MIMHTDTITLADIGEATRYATREGGQPRGEHVIATRWTERGSRKRARAFDVILSGNNSRRQNGGTRYADHGRDAEFAATYDEWGHFLAFLFAIDPRMVTPYYNGADDFHTKTANEYKAGALSL